MYEDESDCHEEYEDCYVPNRDATDWKRCSAHPLKPSSNCFWQKKLYQKDENKVYANITEYTIEGKEIYELDIQIPEELSITGMTINISSFQYTDLDFDKIEKQATRLINSYIN